MPSLRATTFLPDDHWLRNVTMNTSIGDHIMRLAGLRPGDMQRFLHYHREADTKFKAWLLGDLAHVQERVHLPVQIMERGTRPDDSSDDEADPWVVHHHNPPEMHVATLYRGADLPKVWASFSQWGNPAAPPTPPDAFRAEGVAVDLPQAHAEHSSRPGAFAMVFQQFCDMWHDITSRLGGTDALEHFMNLMPRQTRLLNQSHAAVICAVESAVRNGVPPLATSASSAWETTIKAVTQSVLISSRPVSEDSDMPPMHPHVDGDRVRTFGFIDMETSQHFMARSFAEKTHLDLSSLDTSASGKIVELRPRPGYFHQLSFQWHRTRYHGLGRIPVTLDLCRTGQEPRLVAINFVVLEDGTLQRGSSVDFVIGGTFARQLPG